MLNLFRNNIFAGWVLESFEFLLFYSLILSSLLLTYLVQCFSKNNDFQKWEYHNAKHLFKKSLLGLRTRKKRTKFKDNIINTYLLHNFERPDKILTRLQWPSNVMSLWLFFKSRQSSLKFKSVIGYWHTSLEDFILFPVWMLRRHGSLWLEYYHSDSSQLLSYRLWDYFAIWV